MLERGFFQYQYQLDNGTNPALGNTQAGNEIELGENSPEFINPEILPLLIRDIYSIRRAMVTDVILSGQKNSPEGLTMNEIRDGLRSRLGIEETDPIVEQRTFHKFCSKMVGDVVDRSQKFDPRLGKMLTTLKIRENLISDVQSYVNLLMDFTDTNATPFESFLSPGFTEKIGRNGLPIKIEIYRKICHKLVQNGELQNEIMLKSEIDDDEELKIDPQTSDDILKKMHQAGHITYSRYEMGESKHRYSLKETAPNISQYTSDLERDIYEILVEARNENSLLYYSRADIYNKLLEKNSDYRIDASRGKTAKKHFLEKIGKILDNPLINHISKTSEVTLSSQNDIEALSAFVEIFDKIEDGSAIPNFQRENFVSFSQLFKLSKDTKRAKELWRLPSPSERLQLLQIKDKLLQEIQNNDLLILSEISGRENLPSDLILDFYQKEDLIIDNLGDTILYISSKKDSGKRSKVEQSTVVLLGDIGEKIRNLLNEYKTYNRQSTIISTEDFIISLLKGEPITYIAERHGGKESGLSMKKIHICKKIPELKEIFEEARKQFAIYKKGGKEKGQKLSFRQKEVLSRRAKGDSQEQIASDLKIELNTVKNHINDAKNIYQVDHVLQLIKIALKNEEIIPEDFLIEGHTL
ncbi:MAG TPA: LuxR C-terminal-related transcriptional regulator, partial [Candidatus Saccharimonadales bacterium]|nr:LuxR C-terminal-related transcriptional regulator [Candidatus Saccharimonadales bacterium]